MRGARGNSCPYRDPEIPGIELCSPLWRIQTKLEATLKDNEEGFAGIALCAFKGAQIETRFVRLDAGQPHRFAASGAVQNSDLRNAKKWIGLSGQHDTPLGAGGSATLSVTDRCQVGR